MEFKTISSKIFEKKKNSRLNSRRAVADIISTMLLMAITVTGASTLTYFVNDGFISGNLGTISTLDSSSLNVLLLAYDTRDSTSLLTLNTVDNKISGALCAIGCIATPANSLPINDGTEFIVLQIQNNGLNPLYLDDVTVNGIIYFWDSDTAGIDLNASTSYLSGSSRPYPADGTFSILPVGGSPITQNDSIQIQNGQQVNLLIKLSTSNSDIPLANGIHILLDLGSIHSVEFLIDSGDAR
jgi:hypothetical protein